MPAAAVIPAPIAYIKVVAVKKLVVGFLVGATIPGLIVRVMCCLQPSSWRTILALVCWDGDPRHLL